MTTHSTSKIIQQAYDKAYLGRVDEALAILRQALQSPDPKGLVSEAIGFICFQNARYGDAADSYAISLQTAPRDVKRLHYMTLSLGLAGRWEDAEAALSHAAAENPASVGPAASLCLLLVEKDDLPNAREAYDRARKIMYEHPNQSAPAMGLMEQCAQNILALPSHSSR